LSNKSIRNRGRLARAFESVSLWLNCCADHPVDEEVKELVLGNLTVCLLWLLGHIFSKQTSQLTGFVMY
jgi:hypothetical protein